MPTAGHGLCTHPDGVPDRPLGLGNRNRGPPSPWTVCVHLPNVPFHVAVSPAQLISCAAQARPESMWLDVAAGGSKWQALGQHGIMPSVSAEPPRIGSGLVAKPGLGSICLSACDDLSGSTRSILAFLLALLLSPRNTRAQRLTPPPRRSWAPFSISFSWGIISPPSPTTPAKLLHMVPHLGRIWMCSITSTTNEEALH
ncbi:hypothetical protein VDGL01_05281 [Verticillium dahliae]